MRDQRRSLRCVVFAPFWSKKSSGAARLARRWAAPFPSLRPPFWKERSLRGAGLWRSRRCRFARFVAGTVRGDKKKGNAGKLLRYPSIKTSQSQVRPQGPFGRRTLLPRASMIFHDFDIPRFSVFCFWGAVIPRAGSPSPPSADRPTPSGGLALPGAAKRKASWGGGKCAGRIRRGGDRKSVV